MVEIIFQNKEDARKLYSKLEKQTELSDKVFLFEEKQAIKINVHLLEEPIQNNVIDIFYEFILITKRDDWFRKILAEQFYYDDVDEQQAILDIIYSIIDGENKELAELIVDGQEKKLLKMAVMDLLQDTNIAFSFEAFVKFRLREFLEKLLKYVELSIDEYKMEQEYQMFIHTLREFLNKRHEKVKYLHLVYDEEPTFFNDEFEEIKRAELTKMIDRKLLSNHPVYVDSVTIAPLLSIAPRTIYLYAKNPDDPLVRTIRNIFEERVILKSIEQFYEAQIVDMKKVSENW
ncbi:putative sporulation protein YtxC [Neobacillus sp. D3-1R]|uniref:putative sporulation protein YtxC n=1 Tax=Neobacillus sp. D3-1R TaxID=3445778 RepID=UPI003F9F7F70